MKTLKEIWRWIRNPDELELDISLVGKCKLLIKVFLIDFLFAIVFLALAYVIHHHVVRIEQSLEGWDLWTLLLFGVIVIPFLEELVFRFPLKFKRNYIVRFFNFLTKGWVRHQWDKVFKWFVYLMAVAFGLVHISNYTNSEVIFYILSPILVGSQIVGGFTLSFVRIKLGFMWGVLQHGVFNLIVMTVSLAFVHNTTMIEVSNSEYDLEVKSLMFVDTDDSYIRANIVNSKVYHIEANDYGLQALLSYIGLGNVEVYDDTWVDFNFDSEVGIPLSQLYQLIEKEVRFKEKDRD